MLKTVLVLSWLQLVQEPLSDSCHAVAGRRSERARSRRRQRRLHPTLAVL